jgi:sporulation protein YlmC with PRC-barrel domain
VNFNISKLTDFLVHAQDGDVGRVEQFYFDDLIWSIRYLTIRTKGGLPRHNVLIPVVALLRPEWAHRTLPIELAMAQVFSSPSTVTEEPVSRRYEIELHRYYAWPGYWDGSFYVPNEYTEKPKDHPLGLRKVDPHLRSLRELTNTEIFARNEKIGTVADIVVDDHSWNIRYLIVNSRKHLKHVSLLVSPHWIEKVSWQENRLVLDLDPKSLLNSPDYSPDQPITADFEKKLCSNLQKNEVKEWVQLLFHAPAKTKIYLAGTFNNWSPTTIKLGYHGKATYSTMLLLPAGYYEYKFIVNGIWQNNPECKDLVPNTLGSQNCRLVVKHSTDHNVHPHTFPRLKNSECTRLWSS